ncbi:hypothetical protein [Methylobacterium sp. JK268]
MQPVRRTSLIIKLIFLLGALASALDGWSGLPIGFPPGHAAAAQRHHGDNQTWAVLSVVLSDDERSHLEAAGGGAAVAPALLTLAAPDRTVWHRPAPHPQALAWARSLSSASPRGPPRVS